MVQFIPEKNGMFWNFFPDKSEISVQKLNLKICK
jgi:hypothetical protein